MDAPAGLSGNAGPPAGRSLAQNPDVGARTGGLGACLACISGLLGRLLMHRILRVARGILVRPVRSHIVHDRMCSAISLGAGEPQPRVCIAARLQSSPVQFLALSFRSSLCCSPVDSILVRAAAPLDFPPDKNGVRELLPNHAIRLLQARATRADSN